MEGKLSRRTLGAVGAVATVGERAPGRAASGPGSAAREAGRP
jgi:hypothetical protein